MKVKQPRFDNGRFAPKSEFMRWFMQQFPKGDAVQQDTALKAWVAARKLLKPPA